MNNENNNKNSNEHVSESTTHVIYLCRRVESLCKSVPALLDHFVCDEEESVLNELEHSVAEDVERTECAALVVDAVCDDEAVGNNGLGFMNLPNEYVLKKSCACFEKIGWSLVRMKRNND